MADDWDQFEDAQQGTEPQEAYNSETGETRPVEQAQKSGWDQFEDARPQQAQNNEWDQFEDARPQQQERPDEGNQRTWGEEIGRDIRTAVRGVVPAIGAVGGAIIGGGLAGAAGSVVPIAGTTAGLIAGGVGGAVAGSNIAQAVQDKLGDALGVDSPESRAADATNPSWGTTAAEIIPDAAALTTGAGEVNIATRLASGALMGGVNLFSQGIQKGPSNINPGEALTQAAVGAALPKARPWLEGAVARTGLPTGGPMAQDQGPAGARGLGNGTAPQEGRTDGNVNAAVDEEAKVPSTRAEDAPVVSRGVATENSPTPEANTPPAGVQTGDGFTAPGSRRDYGVGTPRAQEGIPGARTESMVNLDPADGYSSDVLDTVRGQEKEPDEAAQTQAPQGPEPAPQDPEQGPPANEQAPQAPGQTVGPERSARIDPNRLGEVQGETILGATPNMRGRLRDGTEVQLSAGAGTLFDGNGDTYDPNLFTHIKSGQTNGEWIPVKQQAPGQAPIVRFRQMATGIQDSLPPVDPNNTRLWRGNRPGETGKNPTFTNDLAGIALPFQEVYGGPLSYVDVPTAALAHFENKAGAAPGAEFTLPAAQAARATKVELGRPLTPIEQRVAEMKARRAEGTLAEQAPRAEQAEPQFSDEELDNQIEAAKPKPQPLSGEATTQEDMGYGPNAPRAAVKAKNGGLWQRANNTFDKLFSLPQWIFSPATISDQGMQADKIISKHMGMGKSDLAQYQDALRATDTYFHNMSPGDRTSAVTDYENGSIPKDHPGAAWMEQARKTSDKLDNALNAAGGTDTYARQAIPSFFEEGQRQKLRDDMDLFKQENNRFPTLGEAVKMGFKLRDDLVNADGSPDPSKVVNQQNFAKEQALELQNVIKDTSEGWKAEPGIQAADPLLHPAPGEGLVKIDPALTNGASKYAAPEVKAILERYFNPTLRDGNIKSAYESYMKLKNADNALALATGLYHLRFMFQEAPINEVSAGFARLLKNPNEAIKDILKAPAAPYTLFKQGKNNVFDAIMHPESVKDPFDRVVLNTLKEGGMLPGRVRGMGVTPELETGAVKGLASAWKPAFQEYMRDQVQAGLKIRNKAQAGDYVGAGKDTSVATLRAFTEGMQFIMHPLFNTYIPMLKAGANFSNMKRFYIDNPGLSHDQYVNMAKKFVRATDNAMGELNQSTLYAPAYVKAIGNGAMVSLGWNIGDVKQFLGGARAFARNPKASMSGADYDPRIMYMPAFLAVTALSNIAVQLLHGQGPPQDLTDVAFPRSGGKTKKGNPERIIQPGYEKDVAEAANIVGGPEPIGQNFAKMMYNKLAPFPKTALDIFLYNQNFAGKQIANPNDPFAKRLQDYLSYFEKHALTPIAVQSATQGNNPNTKIGTVERVLGNRHAPAQWEDPKEYAARIKKQNERGAKESKTFHEKTGY